MLRLNCRFAMQSNYGSESILFHCGSSNAGKSSKSLKWSEFGLLYSLGELALCLVWDVVLSELSYKNVPIRFWWSCIRQLFGVASFRKFATDLRKLPYEERLRLGSTNACIQKTTWRCYRDFQIPAWVVFCEPDSTWSKKPQQLPEDIRWS